jgi:hypothetical protein
MRDKDVRDERSWERFLWKYSGWMLLETDEDTGLSTNMESLENPITPLSGMLYVQRCSKDTLEYARCSLLFKQVIEYGMGLVIRFVD